MFGDYTQNLLSKYYRPEFYNDKNTLRCLKDSIIYDLHIEDFLEYILLRNLDGNKIGIYYPDLKTIYVNVNIAKNETLRMIKEGKLNSQCAEEYTSLNVLLTILHEAIHAYQQLHMKNSNYMNILQISEDIMMGNVPLLEGGKAYSRDNVLRSVILYHKYHDLYPAERQAIIEPVSFIYPVLKHRVDIKILNDFRINTILSSLNPYVIEGKLSSPISQFFINTIGHDITNSLDISNLSERDKFIFGLPLSIDNLSNEVSNIFHLNDNELIKRSLKVL